MYTAAVEIVFPAGHYLDISGIKESLHQHDWRVRAQVGGQRLNQYELVVDFHLLQRLLLKIIEPISRTGVINELDYFKNNPINPSAERVAEYIYKELEQLLPQGVKLLEITVWETDDCRASFRREKY